MHACQPASQKIWVFANSFFGVFCGYTIHPTAKGSEEANMK